MREVVLEPNWPQTLRYFAFGLSMHDFNKGTLSPVGSVMQIAIHMFNTNPIEMMQILREFDAPLREEKTNDSSAEKGQTPDQEV